MSVIDNLLPQEIINKVKKLRAYFQQSLLSWIRNSDEHSRQTMHKVLQQISQLLCNYNDDNQQLNPVNSLENDFAEDNNLENKEMIEENISNQEDIVEENEFDENVTVIKTSYSINGEEGTIAIIGPKRMEYDKVVALLNYLKGYLER